MKNFIEQTSFDHKMNPDARLSKETFIIGFNELNHMVLIIS